MLKLLPASREVLKGERQLTLRRSPAKAARRTRGGAAPRAVPAPGKGSALYEALREWRRATAREHNVPAYTVFHDATLAEIARQLPASPVQLRGIAGVGEAKLARYGVALLDLVRQHAGE